MRELERTAADSPDPGTAATAGGRRAAAEASAAGREPEGFPPTPLSIGIVGPGRVGGALARALREAGHDVHGPTRRGEAPAGDAVLLCVPDAEIEAAAIAVAGSAAFVGHTSGATPLAALDPAGAAAFGLHPLQTIAGPDADLRGCGCAIAGTTAGALALARRLAHELGMEPVEIADEDRAAYHAAASIASNFLLTLEAAAESVAAGAGIEPAEARRLLGPLVRTTLDNWLALGPERALTGPVARGDEPTIAAQRAAVADAAPELVDLFDELVERTRALAGRTRTEVTA
jgi:predicted short-subunit dehydrogenase-like oxidoreductase (DUF2520 family)